MSCEASAIGRTRRSERVWNWVAGRAGCVNCEAGASGVSVRERGWNWVA